MSPWSLIFCSCHFPKLLSEITRNPLVTALGGVCSRSHPHVSLQHFAPLPLPPTNILAFPSFPLSSHSDNIYYFSSAVLLCLFCIFQGFVLSFFPLFQSVPPTPSDFNLVISENLLSLSSPAPPLGPRSCILSALITNISTQMSKHAHLELPVSKMKPLLPRHLLCLFSGFLGSCLYINTCTWQLLCKYDLKEWMNSSYPSCILKLIFDLISVSGYIQSAAESVLHLVYLTFLHFHCHYLDIAASSLLVFISSLLSLASVYISLLYQSWLNGHNDGDNSYLLNTYYEPHYFLSSFFFFL